MRFAPAASTRSLHAATIAALALLLACAETTTVDAPAPAPITGGVDSLPVLPPSLVDAPITYDISPAIERLESSVPLKFGDLEARKQSLTNKRVNTAFAAERAPFTVSFDGSTVRVGTILEYQGKGWYKAPLGGDLFGSCGLGAARPRAVVELMTTLRVTPEWRLRGKSAMTRVEAFSNEKRDQCKVTIFKIDVTDRVVSTARTELEKRLVALDEKIAGIDIRSPMERWWRVLQKPVRLSDSVWLILQPKNVHMGPITGNGRTVAIDVGLTGEPRVVTGPRPADGVAPLPALKRETDKHDQALHVLLEGEMSYELANGILKKNVVGKRIRRGARWVTLRDARLSGIGAGRVALALKFDGAASGLVYLVGTPKYDPETRQLFVPDLAYDVSSADMLVRGLEFMRRGDVQQMLRTRARFPVADLVEQARQRLERGMNRQLGQNATLVAKVATGDVLAVRATTSGILVRAAANGTARLEVIRIPALSRQ